MTYDEISGLSVKMIYDPPSCERHKTQMPADAER